MVVWSGLQKKGYLRMIPLQSLSHKESFDMDIP
jgi:hypothetical protein